MTESTPPQKPAEAQKRVDWELVERYYRAGILSLREIAKDAGISEGAIRKRATRDQWSRDLAAKIKQKADDLVRKAEVRTPSTQLTPRTEQAVIEANAEAIAQVRLAHRKDIRRGRAIVSSLFDEIEMMCGTENAALLVEFGELMRSEDKNGMDRRNDIYEKLLSLPGRVKSMKELGEALKNMIALERETYNLDDPASNDLGAAGAASGMTDAERAVRVARMFTGNPDAVAALVALRGRAA